MATAAWDFWPSSFRGGESLLNSRRDLADRPGPADPSAPGGGSDRSGWHPDGVAAELAEGAVRDQVARRVAELEQEVVQLRRALSQVLEAAAKGVRVEEPDAAASRVGDTGRSTDAPA
jgi:hypothetical protein